MTGDPLSITGVYETILYAPDLDQAERFYTGVLGLEVLTRNSDRGMSFRLGEWSVLLIFQPDLTALPHELVPSHGAHGPGHIAFTVGADALDAWRDRLTGAGVEVEREVDWPTGSHSIYFRDPAGNSLELTSGQIWPDQPERD